jgi:hypothetical protein
MSFRIGDEVELRPDVDTGWKCPNGRENNKTAIIEHIGGGGEVRTDKDLRGCRWWNVNDLQLRSKT